MRKLPVSFFLVAAALTALTAPAVAARKTADVAAPADGPQEYCSAIVSKERDAEGFSKVVGKACSTVSPEDAYQRAKRQAPARADGAELERTSLLDQYKHANFGTLLYTYWGDSGPCDREGYFLRNLDHVAEEVSSMRGYNNCNTVDATTIDWPKYTGTPCTDSGYVGDRLNDNVYSLQIYNRFG